MGTAATKSAGKKVDHKATGGKYLTFALSNEDYGIEILKVREIIGYMDVTTVPNVPSYVKGVINLRGQVVPVIELRSKFQMESEAITDETCIIIAEIGCEGRTFSCGMIVDRVLEVLDIKDEQIEGSPEFGDSVDTTFILGMAKINNAVKILLDINKVVGGMNGRAVADIAFED